MPLSSGEDTKKSVYLDLHTELDKSILTPFKLFRSHYELFFELVGGSGGIKMGLRITLMLYHSASQTSSFHKRSTFFVKFEVSCERYPKVAETQITIERHLTWP